MKITAEQIMSHRPCAGYPESRVRELVGDGLTPVQVCDLPIPAEDRIWVLTRQGAIPERLQRRIALLAARDCLPIWEREYPDDRRPRAAIAATYRWLRNPNDETAAAAAEAAGAAQDAAGVAWAAWATAGVAWAAWATAWATVGAAQDAAWDAWDAWDAARAAQDATYDRIISYARQLLARNGGGE